MTDIVERLRACAEHRAMWSTGLANQAADEIERLTVTEPTGTQIADACLNYRHDFGLMSVEERQRLANEAKWWLDAWRKALSRAALTGKGQG